MSVGSWYVNDDDDDHDHDDDVHLVRELVHVLPREDPPCVWVPQVGSEDVQVLVEDALELLVGDRAAGLHLHPLDPQSAGQLQTDPAKRGCLEDGRLQNNLLSYEGRDQGQVASLRYLFNAAAALVVITV